MAVSISMRSEVFAMTGGRCFYCGIDLDDTFHADHVIPQSRGGADHIDNLVPACCRCNLSKGTKLIYEWMPLPSMPFGMTDGMARPDLSPDQASTLAAAIASSEATYQQRLHDGVCVVCGERFAAGGDLRCDSCIAGPPKPRFSRPGGKLTFEQAEEIRRLYESGRAQRWIAKKYGVSKSYVAFIVHHKVLTAEAEGLTDTQVREIRQRYRRPAHQESNLRDLAAEYGISLRYAHALIAGWKRGEDGGPITRDPKGRHKLSAEQVSEMRRRHAAGGVTTHDIADQFGVSQRTAWQVIRRKTWQHVD